MSNRIEDRFRTLVHNDQKFNLLLGQWEFDRELITRALANVGHIFPHYSVHDVSHSQMLLTRIESILGSGLNQLGATDLWLLLESTFLHDAGMISTATTREKDLKSIEFTDFVERMSIHEDDFGQSCKAIMSCSIVEELSTIDEKYRDLTIVYSEFVRQRHAERAENAVCSPVETIATDLPRNGLIPKRFWHLIGQICKAHGQDKEAVMALPYQENGFGGDLCHPRFIAAMLRLGDLLDLDSDRFCSTLNAMIKSLPKSSQAHQRKHEGIIHFLVNNKKVEVTGVYEDIDAYLAAEMWFALLHEELTTYTLRWDEIDPEPSVGRLPMAGKIEARLAKQILLAHGARPRFELDRKKVLSLVRGSNIYEGPQDAIREIVQNAIDATLLRYSYDCQCTNTSSAISPNELRKNLEKYPINIKIERINDIVEHNPEYVYWKVIVRDEGIGMRIDDIRFMLSLGSSKNNDYRNKLKNWLPEWARPSGSFGIGFHSIFEHSQKVSILTRHPNCQEIYSLEFESPRAGDEPYVIVRNCSTESAFPISAGTAVEFLLKVERVPKRMSLNFLDDNEVNQAVENYDFVRDEEIEYLPSKMRARIRSIARDSLCKILLDGTTCKNVFKTEEYTIFDEATGLEVSLRGLSLRYNTTLVKYRGAEVNGGPSLPMLDIECNIHSGDASELLELSRNKLTRNGRDFIFDKLQSAIPKCTIEWLEALKKTPKNINWVRLLSLYNYLYENIESDEWKDIELECENEKITLQEMISFNTIDVVFDKEHRNRPNIKIEKHEEYLKLVNFPEPINPYEWFPLLMNKHFLSRCLRYEDGIILYRLKKSDTVIEDVEPSATVKIVNHHRYGLSVGCRRTIPCAERYAILSISNDYSGWGIYPDLFISRLMPNPFVFKDECYFVPNLNELIDWVVKHTGHQRREVIIKLKDFMKEVESNLTEDDLTPRCFDFLAINNQLSGMV